MSRVPNSDATAGRPSKRSRNIGPAILRIAGWPIETINALQSPQLAARADEWIRNDDAIRRESDALARRLHEAIPQIDDQRTRRTALELKRYLHGTTQPVPESLVAGVLNHDRVRETLGRALEAATRRRNSHSAERDSIEHAHAAELERARGELDRITSDDRFLRALCLASPSTFRQWQHARRNPINRRNRHRLQSTLHRYVMRAVGRATPNGLWAGIALEDVNADPTVPLTTAPVASVTRVSPALAVFARALQNMNLRRPWIDVLALRLNPTVRRVSRDVWEFGTFVDGDWCVQQIAHHTAIETLAAKVSPSDRPFLHEIETILCRGDPGMDPVAVRQFAESMIEVGLLWSTAAIPPIYANTWQALDAIIETLPPSEKPLWQGCREELARIANDIQDGIDRIDANTLRRLLDDARFAADAVFTRYESPVPSEHDVLVVDRAAPFRFSISSELANAIEDKLRVYWTFDRFGLGEIETQAGIRHFFGLAPDGGRVPLHEFLSRGAEADPGGRTRSWEDRVLAKAAGELAGKARDAFARWEQEIDPSFADPVHRLEAEDISAVSAMLPPGSALLLFGASERGSVLRIGGVTPEPCFFYSRFSYLFCGDERAPDPFLAWHRAGIGEIESRWPQLRFLDLAVRNHRNPNVAARPRTASQLIDPLADDGRALREATIACNRDGRPVLSIAREPQRLIPSARSAAYLGGLDRFASILASLSAFLGRPPLLAPMPRFSREIETWRHLPRLVLADTTISPERWTPPDDFGDSLAQAHGAERFIRWRRFVRTAGLPDFVYAFHGRHQTESLLPTDSALAVEFLGHELKGHGPSLLLQELFPAPEQFVVRDDAGRRYVAELAVAWQGDAEFWNRYVESGLPNEDAC